jgi:hypothetical protein
VEEEGPESPHGHSAKSMLLAQASERCVTWLFVVMLIWEDVW